MMADSENLQPNGGAVIPKRDTNDGSDGPAAKRQRLDPDENPRDASQPQPAERKKGVAPVKPECVFGVSLDVRLT